MPGTCSWGNHPRLCVTAALALSALQGNTAKQDVAMGTELFLTKEKVRHATL